MDTGVTLCSTSQDEPVLGDGGDSALYHQSEALRDAHAAAEQWERRARAAELKLTRLQEELDSRRRLPSLRAAVVRLRQPARMIFRASEEDNEYRARSFQKGYNFYLAIFAVVIARNVGFVQTYNSDADVHRLLPPFVVYDLAVFVLRWHVHRFSDQMHAARVFGRYTCCAWVLFCVALQYRLRAYPILLSAEAAKTSASLIALGALSPRAMRLLPEHHAFIRATSVLSQGVAPAWSELGHCEENLLVWSATVHDRALNRPFPMRTPRAFNHAHRTPPAR